MAISAGDGVVTRDLIAMNDKAVWRERYAVVIDPVHEHLYLVEFPDQRRDWVSDVRPHTVHEWEVVKDEMPPHGPYLHCKVCNEIRDIP